MIVIINDLRETKFYIVAKDELQQFIKNKNIALSEEMQYKGNYEMLILNEIRTNTKKDKSGSESGEEGALLVQISGHHGIPSSFGSILM